MKEGGIYVSTEFGPYVQNPFLVLWTSVFGKRKVVFPIPKDSKEDAAFVAMLWEKGAYQAVIDRRYTLAEVPEAYRYAETGEKRGNLIITVGDRYNAI